MKEIVIECACINIQMRAITPSEYSISPLIVIVLTIKFMAFATFASMPVEAITFKLSLIIKLIRVVSPISFCLVVDKLTIVK